MFWNRQQGMSPLKPLKDKSRTRSYVELALQREVGIAPLKLLSQEISNDEEHFQCRLEWTCRSCYWNNQHSRMGSGAARLRACSSASLASREKREYGKAFADQPTDYKKGSTGRVSHFQFGISPAILLLERSKYVKGNCFMKWGNLCRLQEDKSKTWSFLKADELPKEPWRLQEPNSKFVSWYDSELMLVASTDKL